MATYRPIEDLSSPDFRALVFEDEDGFRILQIEEQGAETLLPARTWAKAYEAGVAMLLVGTRQAVSTDHFMQTREEVVSSNAYRVLGLQELAEDQPPYRSLLMSSHREPDGEPSDPLATTKFVHLHTHTEYSQLDGLSTMREVFETVSQDPHGGGAVGSADHGNCAGHPEQQALADEFDMKAIFGMEAYFVPNRHRRSRSWSEIDGVEVNPEHLTAEEKKKVEKKSDAAEVKGEYTHLTLWAMNDIGLRNLWALSTEAYREGLYDGKPRMDWETLERFQEGLICGTGCIRGPVTRPLVTCECSHGFDDHPEGECRWVDKKTEEKCSCLLFASQTETARENLMRLHGIFGDRLYVEVHTNLLPMQVYANETLAKWCADYKIPPLAVVDSHYAVPEHQIVHKAWVAMQTGKTLTEDTSLFQGEQDYHLKTCDEVVAALQQQGLSEEFIYEATENTVEVARRCDARVGGKVTTPTFSKPSKEHPDPVQRDVERLIEVCTANWDRKVVGKRHSEQEYLERFEREIALLIQKGFCGYFLIVWDYVSWAKKQGCLVGPGRGSGGGSLVAYLADIVEVDPVDSDLIFERFLTEGRNSLPDFDIDFPSSWRGRIITYIKERWGEDYVANIGTVTRLRSKQAINDTVRAMTPLLEKPPDFKSFDLLKKTVDEADRPLAGKHLPWDEFKAQYADIVEPLEREYPDIFAVVDVVMDRVKTYGKHAAGIVISTDTPLTDLPMRLAMDNNTKTEVMVTQFDMNALEVLGYVKFDFLTLRTLDTLQVALDLIEERYKAKINPYDWKGEYEDPQVWGEVCDGRTLGLFQIETASGTRLTKRMQPENVFDLAAVMTVVRPGPMRSGLTESYLRRRAGFEPITYLDPRLEDFLGYTYGSMIYQEQVMATCMNLAGYDSTEADGVRKLLGKKQVEKVKAAGEEFVRRAVECGTDPDVAETLWAQMAEFAKYGFNKAHAFAYAVLGYWCAFLRFHYPVEFLVAALSTVDADRIPEFIEDCRRSGYEIVPPSINRSGVEFTATGTEIIYGLSMVKGIGEDTAKQIVRMAPYKSLDDFVERCVKFSGSKVNMGHVRTLVEVGAFDEIVPNRRAIEQQLTLEAEGHFKRCVFKTDPSVATAHPFGLPCAFDWGNEPDPPMLPRGRGKDKTYVAKPPPKKCTTACRQFRAPEPVSVELIEPYSGHEIMLRERELLGVWITHSPFESISTEALEAEDVFTAQQIEAAPAGTWHNGYALVEEVKKRKDKNGNDYAFVKVNMQDGVIEAICFASVWEGWANHIVKDALCVITINKTPRGYQLVDFLPL